MEAHFAQSPYERVQGSERPSTFVRRGKSRAALRPVSLMPKCVFEDFSFHHARPHVKQLIKKRPIFFRITRTNPVASLREITSLRPHTRNKKKSVCICIIRSRLHLFGILQQNGAFATAGFLSLQACRVGN